MNYWQMIYSLIVVPLIYALAKLASLFNLKIRENLRARQGYLQSVAAGSASLGSGPRFWFHCASMGEYEALVPLLEAIRRQRTCRVVLTFFSTSGLNNFRDYHLVDLVTFAPLDFQRDVRRFIELISPDLYVVTKHDIWPNTLWEVNRRGIPALLINGNFHPGTLRLRPFWRPFFREVFSRFDKILPVTTAAARKFRRLLPETDQLLEPGETRYDRVVQRLRASGGQQDNIPGDFCRDSFVFIAGSTWPPGEQRLLTACADIFHEYPRFRLILVPHEPLPSRILQLEQELTRRKLRTIRYSSLSSDTTGAGEQVIIVDKVGLLAGLYRHAAAAYVGGGFTTGVHSVIEPAAFSVPVLFGPRHGVSAEAEHLLTAGGGFVVTSAADFAVRLRAWLAEPAARQAAGAAALSVVERNTGTTERIHELLRSMLQH